MDNDTKKEISASLLNWLKKEINDWQNKGIINSDQGEEIQKQYQLKERSENKEEISKKTIRYLLFIAVFFMGAGVFSFIASNREKINDFLRVGIIVSAMLISYIAGWYLQEKRNYKKTGGALILLGSVIYGAGIFLVAQIFNIRANWPDGFILWMIGSLMMAFAVKLRPLYFLSIILGFIAVIGHPFIIFNYFSGYNKFLLTSSFLLLIAFLITLFSGIGIKRKVKEIFSFGEDRISQLFLVLSILFFGITLFGFNKDFGDILSWRLIILISGIFGLFISYYFKTVFALVISLPMIVAWFSSQFLFWARESEIKIISIYGSLIMVFLLFYILGKIHEFKFNIKQFSFIYLIFGIIPITGTLFYFSTYSGLSVLDKFTQGNLFFQSWEMTTIIFLQIAFIIYFILYFLFKKREIILKSEIIFIIILLVFSIIIISLPYQNLFNFDRDYYSFDKEITRLGIFWAVVLNLFVFLELLGIIFLGYLKRENYLINLGILFLFLLVFLKYFDWFFEFIDKSLFFIIGGVILLGIGWLMERGRKYIIGNIEGENTNK